MTLKPLPIYFKRLDEAKIYLQGFAESCVAAGKTLDFTDLIFEIYSKKEVD